MTAGLSLPNGEPQVLRPYHRSEALSIAEAAWLASPFGQSESGVRVSTLVVASAASGP